MTIRCEDYPCCGHTDGLGCNWTPPTFENPEDFYEPGSPEYWDARWEREEDEDSHNYDHDDINDSGVPWCWGCDDYATCGNYEPDGAPVHQWEVTTPPEVYMNEDQWLDGSYEE